MTPDKKRKRNNTKYSTSRNISCNDDSHLRGDSQPWENHRMTFMHLQAECNKALRGSVYYNIMNTGKKKIVYLSNKYQQSCDTIWCGR